MFCTLVLLNVTFLYNTHLPMKVDVDEDEIEEDDYSEWSQRKSKPSTKGKLQHGKPSPLCFRTSMRTDIDVRKVILTHTFQV